MSALSDKIDAVQKAAKDTEARVTAHEAALKQTAADLQAQIDALKAGGTVTDADLAGLQGIADELNAFDPDAAPPA